MQAGRRARRVLKGKAEKSMARDRPSSWRAGGRRGCCGVSSEGASVHPVPERARGSHGALQFSPCSVTSLSPLLHPRLAPVKALPQPIPHHTAAVALGTSLQHFFFLFYYRKVQTILLTAF